MKLYADVGVVRIQEYILRTSGADEGQLRKRRGASRMISAATDPGRFAGFYRNAETYQVEGVAHLASDDTTDPRGRVRSAMATLRRELPQAYLSASWALATDYEHARQIMEASKHGIRRENADGTAGLLEWVPALREDAAAPSCKGCGASPQAIKDLCRDCCARDDRGAPSDRTGAGYGEGGAAGSPEDRARRAAEKQVGRALRRPKDLSAIGRAAVATGAKGNHVATVYADGNNVGATFRAITEPSQARELSRILDGAIKSAGCTALSRVVEACAGGQGADLFPASVTVLAADDVLITVPAPLGWDFVTTLIGAFNDEVQSNLAALPDRLPSVTLTAGIVFSHAKEPIERAIAEAESAMRRAKGESRGAESAVGWGDLTQRRSERFQGSRPIGWFHQHSDLINSVASLPAHQRNRWLVDLTDGFDSEVPSNELIRYVRSEAGRLGLAFMNSEDVLLEDLATALGIASWWSAAADPSEADDE